MLLALTDVLNWVLPIGLGLFIGFLLATRNKSDTKNNLITLEPEEFRNNMRKGQLIDIRNELDYKAGHINGSRNFPKREILASLFKLRADQAVFLYGSTDKGQVKRLASKLIRKGYHPVYILKGGFENWSFTVKK